MLQRHVTLDFSPVPEAPIVCYQKHMPGKQCNHHRAQLKPQVLTRKLLKTQK